MEHIITPKVEHVKLMERYNTKKSASGTLYLTATHLIYVEQDNNNRKETWILHHHISSVEKLSLTASGCPLIIHCKTFQHLHLLLPREREAQDVLQSLQRLSQPVKDDELYAFLFSPQDGELDRSEGWSLIDMSHDFGRMGLPNELWEISHVNNNYEVCSTYPPLLCIPKSASVAMVTGSAKFRSRGRLPVLSYFHRETKAAICRCSQPLSGLNSRCVEDEQMLQAISQANPNCPFIYVVDTRPKLNAMANRAAGKGYENEDNYSNIRFHFQGIENIHVMRTSLQKLLELCNQKSPSMSDYLTGLESSGWLRHIKAVMDAGVFLAKAVGDEGASVLVHCSDGWDRTAQVCSIASILLDPYYRTIKGLLVLIEKEWIAFGHKFSQRCGHLEGDPKEVSPVFTQFVECVWQLSEQFPCAFQFNQRLLLTLHDHAHACQYGNFLCNNQRERQHARLRERTFSLWPYVLQHQDQFRNPLYKRSAHNGQLRPSTLPLHFKFWCGMYNRFDKGMQPKQCVLDTLLNLSVKLNEQESNMTQLQRQLAIADGVIPAPPGPVTIFPEPENTPKSPCEYPDADRAALPNGVPGSGSGSGSGSSPGSVQSAQRGEEEEPAPEHLINNAKDKQNATQTQN